jgi:hypothetical protein
MYLGDQVQLVAELPDGRQLIAREQRSQTESVSRLEPGDAVRVRWDESAPLLLGRPEEDARPEPDQEVDR